MSDIILGAVTLGLLWSIAVLGVYITYRVLDIADLSVEGTITLGAAVAAQCITSGMNPFLGTLFAALAGLLAGLVTGLLHTKLHISPLLAGILTMTALYSVNLRIMGKATISLGRRESTVYTALQTTPLGKCAPLLLGLAAAVAVALVLYWFFGTELGSSIRATGSNPSMVRAQGINTDTMKILGLMISNGLVGLAGALIAQYQAFADIQMGIGSIVICLASLIIGEVLFGTRSFKNTLISVVLGAIIYRGIIAAVLYCKMSPNDLRLFTAITVAICLALPRFQSYVRTLIHSAAGRKEGN